MRLAAVTLLVFALAAPAAGAARVEVLVVGKSGVLRDGAKLTPKRTATRIAGRRCRVAGRTPLAALLRTGLPVRVRDYGSCGRRAGDSTSLFVTRVGPDRNRGRDGWVYKTGRVTSSLGAADPASRVRARVLWFWCVTAAGGGCQRTLDAVPERTAVVAGEQLRVTVRGYDDSGRGVPVGGATVRLGAASAVTGADGVATLTAPAGAREVVAEHAGMVRSFGARVVVS